MTARFTSIVDSLCTSSDGYIDKDKCDYLPSENILYTYDSTSIENCSSIEDSSNQNFKDCMIELPCKNTKQTFLDLGRTANSQNIEHIKNKKHNFGWVSDFSSVASNLVAERDLNPYLPYTKQISTYYYTKSFSKILDLIIYFRNEAYFNPTFDYKSMWMKIEQNILEYNKSCGLWNLEELSLRYDEQLILNYELSFVMQLYSKLCTLDREVENLMKYTKSLNVNQSLELAPNNKDCYNTKRGRQKLNLDGVNILFEWFEKHKNKPYPNAEEKKILCEKTGFTLMQINDWMGNARKRNYKRAMISPELQRFLG